MLGAPVMLIGMAVLYVIRWRLNILTLPDDEAKATGTDIKALRAVSVICATAITASCVSMCGQVGWVGLLVPHMCRMKFGNSHVLRCSPCLYQHGYDLYDNCRYRCAKCHSRRDSHLCADRSYRRTVLYNSYAKNRGVAAVTLTVENGCFSYDGRHTVLSDISFCASPGEIVAILEKRLGQNNASRVQRGLAQMERWT